MRRFSITALLFCLFAWNISNAQWEALNGPPGADVRDMERGPDGTLYVVANLKVFYSTNNGDSWQALAYESPSILDLEGIFPEPEQLGVLYGVNYSRFYKSVDGGLNWELISTDGEFYGIFDVQRFGPDNFLMIYGWNGIYVSGDEGVSWTKIWDREPYDIEANAAGDIFITTSNDSFDEGRIMRYPYPGASPIWDPVNWITVYTNAATSGYDMKFLIDPSSGIYASVYNDVIYSANNGTNWSSVKGDIADNFFSRSVWGQSSDGTIYFTNSYYSPSKIYSTNNQGLNWSTSVSPTDTYGSVSTDICFGSGSTMFLSSEGDGVFRSDDSGASWALKSSGLLFGNGRQITVAADGRILYLNNWSQRGYWTSTDEGATWSFVAIADRTQRILKLSDGKILLHSGGPVYRSTDNGASFVKIDDTYANALVEDASGNLYGADYNAIYKSVDQGDIWTNLSSSITGLPAQYYAEHIAIDQSNANLFAWLYDYSLERGRLYKIPVAGGAATLIDPEPWMETTTGFVNNMFISGNKLYVAKNDAIYESADNGSTWNTIRFSGDRVFPISGGLCVSRRGSLYITQDGGKSWNNSSLPNSNSVIWNLVAVPGGFFAAATASPALKFTGELIVPVDQLPPYVDFNWQPTDGPYGGYISKVFTDNSQNSYVLSDGRLFKTLTFSTWQKLPQPNSDYLRDVVIDKPNNKIYALGYNAISTSTTGGASWSPVNSENIPCRQLIIKCANGNIVFAAGCSNAAVYVSTNGGVNFGAPKLSVGTQTIYKIVSTSTTNALFAHVYDFPSQVRKLMRSINNGDTWVEVATPMPDYQVAADNNGNLYIFWSSMIYRSADDGQNWVNISGDMPFGYISFDADPMPAPGGGMLLAGYKSDISKTGFWKTVNDGVNWTFLPTDLDHISTTSVGQRIVAGTNSGLFTSDDNAATFTERSHGINISNLSDLELINPNQIMALHYGNPSFDTEDFQSWNKRTDLRAVNFFKNPDGSLIANNGRNFFKTTDNGASWTAFGTTPEYFSVLTSGDGVMYFTASGEKIRFSNDFQSWTDLNVSGLPEQFSITSMAVNASGFVFIVLYNNGINTYEAYQILYGAAIKLNQAQSPQNLYYSFTEDKILLYDAAGSILETTDGSSWTRKSAPAGNQLHVTEKDYYFITQYDGTLWLSRNKGQAWQSVGVAGNSSFTNIVVNEYDGRAYATLEDRVVHKSGNIIIPPETVAPVLVALTPANNSNNVSATTTLSLTFNEVIKPVSGKTIRILDSDNPLNPTEVIDAGTGVLNGKTVTFTPITPLVYEKTYFIVVDNGAFTDIFDNPYAGFNNNSTWRFTVQVQPDAIKPTIAYTHNAKAFIDGTANKLQIVVTDEGSSGVNTASVKIHYRGIMSDGVLTAAVISNPSGSTYEVAIPDGWLDELGLEYVFEAKDNQGNVQYSPPDGLTNQEFHRGYIAYPAAANPSLPSNLLSPGGGVEDYRIFSIPYKLSEPNMNAVFNELSGLSVKTDYRILHYNTESTEFTEMPVLTSINRGFGYWINIKQPPTIAVENASTPEDSKDQMFSLSLKPGWNQIGNPYPFTISWNAVKIANPSIGVLKTFNGTGWVEDDKMNPFEGGFVFLNGTSNISVSIPFTAKTTSGRTKDEVVDFEGGWVLPLQVEDSKFQTHGGIGMHAEAIIGLDPYDDAMPPKLFDIPEIAFAHDEPFIKQFTRDVVPLQDKFVWNFTVHSADESAVLKWDVNGVRALAHDVYLLDEQSQTIINMAEKDHCRLAAQQSSAFKIYYGVPLEDIEPTKITLGKPYPNPFTDISNISFALPENQSGTYKVLLEVYDNLGRRVTTVANGEFTSGFYAGEWVPQEKLMNASLYLYRLKVSDANSIIVLTEKIIKK